MTAIPRVTLDDVRPHHAQPQPTNPVAHVAVLVSLNFPDLTDATAALVARFTRVALETLVKLGASYELFDTSLPLADPGRVAHFDGLMLLGGGDIDGSLYGADVKAPNGFGVDLRADQDGIAAIDAALTEEIPVFGICRGSQLINVARGGSITPDIGDSPLHHGGAGEPLFLDEQIVVEPDSRLAGLLRGGHVSVRSGHHQAVAVLGTGLVASARAHDGVIEAIEDPTRWLMGVQWHPEDDDGSEADRALLFKGFLESCALARVARSRQS